MSYISSSPHEIQKIKDEIGIKNVDELFSTIPGKISNPKIKLGSGIDELDIENELGKYYNKNNNIDGQNCLLGAGAYLHYIPSIVDSLSSRGEFYTAYTPYQAEISQGSLKAIFEFQSYICKLTGLEVSNASLYDGATAMCEAIFMSLAKNKRSKILFSQSLHPHYIEVLKAYFDNLELVQIPYKNDLSLDREKLESELDENVTCVIIQSPNFYGTVENIKNLPGIENKKIPYIQVTNPLSLGYLASGSNFGFDIITGDAQTLGIPLNFGGPFVGFMAADIEFMRKIPGRVCGYTKDRDGKDSFVLTLQAREQHIRRERATSNICSNQALMALRVAIYLSYMGRKGFAYISKLNHLNACYCAEQLDKLKDFEVVNKFFYNEFAVKTNLDYNKIKSECQNNNIVPPYLDPATGYFIFCLTEMFNQAKMDKIIQVLKDIK